MAQLHKTPGLPAQQKLVQHITHALERWDEEHELRTKMGIIDMAYARFQGLKGTAASAQAAGVDVVNIEAQLQAEMSELEEIQDSFVHIEVPLLVSQVDTFVAYQAEVYLSGYPIFGVVSDNKNKKAAHYIENLIEKYSRMSQYARELQLFFRDAAKYNYAPLLGEWDTSRTYVRSTPEAIQLSDKPSIEAQSTGYHRIRRLDPYNAFHDPSVLPGDAAREGDYAGFVELMTVGRLRRMLNRLEGQGLGHVINKQKALAATQPDKQYFNEAPQVSEYTKVTGEMDWDSYLSPIEMARSKARYGSKKEVVTLFMRCDPTDFDLKDDKGDNIYKVVMVNGRDIVYVERVLTAHDMLPMYFGQPVEDGFGYQTQSIGEAAIPMQKASSGLVNLRFHSLRRAVADRALYDSNMIDIDDVNNSGAAAKIPVKVNALVQKGLSEAYYSIPFNDAATQGILSDAQGVADWTSDLNGFNRAAQGRFTKGNRTQTEFSDIQSNSEQRQRLPTIVLENQVFIPLKQQLLLNIMRHASGEVVQAQDTGEQLQVDANELTSVVLDFKVADGYTPKSKISNSDFLTSLLTLLSTNQILAQTYGNRLPEVVAHLAQLGGVGNLDQYSPEAQGNAASQPATGANPSGESGTSGSPQG